MTTQKEIRDYTPTLGDGKGYAFENKLKMEDVLGETITIHRFFIREREYQGEQYTQLTFEASPEDSEDLFVTDTSSQVLIDQLTAERETGLPLRTKIVRRGKYYTLSKP